LARAESLEALYLGREHAVSLAPFFESAWLAEHLAMNGSALSQLSEALAKQLRMLLEEGGHRRRNRAGRRN
jgi:hypothetical protein